MQREPIIQARRQLMTHLERTRRERGLDLTSLAVETGIDPKTIEDILSGNTDASVDHLLSLCLALDVGINLNAAGASRETDELPDVMICDEPINESELYLFHTKTPQSLWHCELVDEGDEGDEDDEDEDEDEDEEDNEADSGKGSSENGLLEFKTWDGYTEQWRVHPVALYEGAGEKEMQKAADRCSKYLMAYLHWEDEEMRDMHNDSF